MEKWQVENARHEWHLFWHLFGVVNGCRERHGAVMSNGGTHDVHRSEPDVNHLYGKTDFNRTRGFLQSGLLLIPPGAAYPLSYAHKVAV
jgi:hypothetical protein